METDIVEINLEEMTSEQNCVDLSVPGAVIAAGLEADNDSISVSHQNLNTGTALPPTVIASQLLVSNAPAASLTGRVWRTKATPRCAKLLAVRGADSNIVGGSFGVYSFWAQAFADEFNSENKVKFLLEEMLETLPNTNKPMRE